MNRKKVVCVVAIAAVGMALAGCPAVNVSTHDGQGRVTVSRDGVQVLVEPAVDPRKPAVERPTTGPAGMEARNSVTPEAAQAAKDRDAVKVEAAGAIRVRDAAKAEAAKIKEAAAAQAAEAGRDRDAAKVEAAEAVKVRDAAQAEAAKIKEATEAGRERDAAKVEAAGAIRVRDAAKAEAARGRSHAMSAPSQPVAGVRQPGAGPVHVVGRQANPSSAQPQFGGTAAKRVAAITLPLVVLGLAGYMFYRWTARPVLVELDADFGASSKTESHVLTPGESVKVAPGVKLVRSRWGTAVRAVSDEIGALVDEAEADRPSVQIAPGVSFRTRPADGPVTKFTVIDLKSGPRMAIVS